MTLNIFFNIGANADLALTNTQNRVDLAMAQLPELVQKQGVVVKKQTPTILMLVAVEATDDRYSELEVNNYASISIADELQRLPGVSNALVINARNYAMRVWLRSDQMAQLGITTSDVIRAIHEQNNTYPIGQLGQPPTDGPVQLTLPITALNRFTTPEEFDNIILRAISDGSTVRLRDVGHTTLGAQDYSVDGELNGKNVALVAIYQMYGANALDVAGEVKQTMERLSQRFPTGITYSIPYDTTNFIKVSIQEVKKTLYEAAVLVALVVFIFLQSLRATIIPVIAMVVSIVGTFAGMHLLGFSINTLTLFGLVLAIGIVVDDAIVVVENVERNIRERGLSSKEAAVQAMEEVSGPVIAIVCVLCAVFIPVAFLGGIAGGLYKQFAITLSISVIISGIVALTLSPVLAAYLLKKERKPSRMADWFNGGLEKVTNGYTRGAAWLMDHTALVAMPIFVVTIAFMLVLLKVIPTSLVPQEDQGYVFVFANLPEEASLNRTEAVTHQIEPIARKNPAVQSVVAFSGFSLLDNLNRTPAGTYFVILKPWDQRNTAAERAGGVLRSLGRQYYAIPEAQIVPVNPPAIQGLGTVGGFEFWIVDQGGGSTDELAAMVQQFIAKAKTRPELTSLMSSIQPNCVQLFADLDRTKARSLDVPIGDVYQTLQAFLGSVYVNNFNKYGRVFQVMVQAEPAYRASLDDIGNIFVRSDDGVMVPINSLVNFNYSKGPNLISRFNTFPAAKINGAAAPGYSSGQAIKAMQEIAQEMLPLSMTSAWSGQAYQEIATGGTSVAVLGAALVLVFLILAALYERWSLPVAILLAVPFGVLGALLAILLRGLENDVYFQIGLVTLIALAAKNAILIVEFAILRCKEGMSVREAALEGARQRFRAIIMTSLTFIVGVLPLVISTGAGAASRHSVGTGVMGGMIVATFFGVFFVPCFYKLMDRKKEAE
jgi:hydrophobe/amphiphile efflux-1 (HAE1) family protein